MKIEKINRFFRQKFSYLSPPLFGLSYSVVGCTKFDKDSSVGTATRYGLGGQEFESRWERDFPHTPRPALGPTLPPIEWVPGPFPGRGFKAVGALTTHPHLAPRLKIE